MSGKRGAPWGNQNARGRRTKIIGRGAVVGGLTGAGVMGSKAALGKVTTFGAAKVAAAYAGSSVGSLGAGAGYPAIGTLTKISVAKAAIGGATTGGVYGAAIGAGATAAGLGAYYAYNKLKARKK